MSIDKRPHCVIYWYTQKWDVENKSVWQKEVLQFMAKAYEELELQDIWLDYIDGQEATDDFTRELEEAVQSVRRNEKWRLDYMTLEQEYRERYNEGVLDGEAKGKIEILYFDMQMTIPEIAKKLSVTEEQVKEIVEVMEKR